jgi:hypothetical protein
MITDTEGLPLKTYENPIFSELSMIKSKARYGKLRGLLEISTRNIYVWDGGQERHGPVKVLLGLSRGVEFEIDSFGGKLVLEYDTPTDKDDLKDNILIKKWLDTGKIDWDPADR